MKVKKLFLQLYNKMGIVLKKCRAFCFPDGVWLMPALLESEEDFQALVDQIILYTQKEVLVQLKLPQICTDPITGCVMDCQELVRQKMAKRLMMMHQPTL